MIGGRHKKLYYVPGLISLILVPLLFSYFANKMYQEANKSAIEINYAGKEVREEYSKELNIPLDPVRKFKRVSIDGNASVTTSKIKYIERTLAKYVANSDTINGMLVTFAATASYSSFVKVIDYKHQYDILAAPFEGGIWLFYKIPEKGPFITCGNTEGFVDEATFIERLRSYFLTIAKFWPSIALLLALVALSIMRLISDIRLRMYQST
jgi:hypothetical protein